MNKDITIREANINDSGVILDFIKGLGEYEKLSHEVLATEQSIKETLFGHAPKAYVLIGEIKGVPCGFALYFYNYSTFLAKPGIYLEDLFVNEISRGTGIGKALLLYLANKAYMENCGRLEWNVLDWNKPALDFYLSIGAKPVDGWTIHRLDEAAIKKLVN